MDYKELQSALKELRDAGKKVNCKLNTSKEVLQDEYNRLTKVTENLIKNNSTIKTIDINAKEWFDKYNGNSYNSVRIVLNFGTKSEHSFNLGIEYGYGNYYLQRSTEFLIEAGKIPVTYKTNLYRYCQENNIIFRENIQTNCRKKDVEAWGSK